MLTHLIETISLQLQSSPGDSLRCRELEAGGKCSRAESTPSSRLVEEKIKCVQVEQLDTSNTCIGIGFNELRQPLDIVHDRCMLRTDVFERNHERQELPEDEN